MFVVDVTNGISWLRGEGTVTTNLVLMRFQAIPSESDTVAAKARKKYKI
jgi:hypothetical protein